MNDWELLSVAPCGNIAYWQLEDEIIHWTRASNGESDDEEDDVGEFAQELQGKRTREMRRKM